MTSTRWSRPESVPYPSVWRRFEGRKAMPDGKVPSFWIQDVTEDMADKVVSHMTEFFLEDEPLTSCTHLRDHPQSLQEIQDLWRMMIRQKVALVALTEGESGPEIAGCNVTGVAFKANKGKKQQFKGRTMTLLVDALDYIGDMVNVYDRYGVEEYMTALGLSVQPKFRGQGIGIELLKARFDIGRAVGLKLTVTVFTAIASQILAARIGMEVLAEVKYEDYRVDGEEVFKIPSVPSMKLMAKRI